jgi:hypothetical protein
MWTGVRVLVWLRRIARALDRANVLAEVRLRLDYPAYARTGRVETRTPRVVDVSTPTVEEWNKRWAETHPEEE